MSVKQNIRNISLEELTTFFLEKKEQKFRAKQVYGWLWEKAAHSFEEMTSLPKNTRTLLNEHFVINATTIALTNKSKDGTLKNIFSLYDGEKVEGVLIPARSRMTACISSQVGCSLDCAFCATGKMKMKRNLDAGEIYDQLVFIRKQAEENFKQPLTNIVYMGMGEPLLNYNNVLASIDRITSPNGLHISPQRITVSTVGIAKKIVQLADDNVKFNLAVSLHAAEDRKRSKIMPINTTNSLAELTKSIAYFHRKTEKTITYEYILFNNFNDSLEDAKQLVSLCEKVPCKVNIIEYNPIEKCQYKKSNETNVAAFVNYLKNNNVIINIRRSKGSDINAACGQLANAMNKS